MKPTIGRIVHYHLSEEDADQINRRRTNRHDVVEGMASGVWPQGAQAHIGNEANKGDCCAMLITAVHDDNHVNGKVMLDGTDVLWALTAVQDTDALPGTWRWPPRV